MKQDKRKRISETAFASQVEDALTRFGWKWMHIKPSIMQSGKWASSMNEGGKGWLDYIALRPPRMIVAELKDAYTKMSPEQEEWFDMWKECQLCYDTSKQVIVPEVYLWRPDNIEDVISILSK